MRHRDDVAAGGPEDFGGEWVEKPDGTIEWVEHRTPGEPEPEPEPFPLDDDECVDDPEALRAAEEAVAHPKPVQPHREPMPDVRWVPIVVVGDSRMPVPVALVSHLPMEFRIEVQEMGNYLQECGIDVGWDPYPPTEVFPHMYRGPRTYSLVVPEQQAAEATRLLEERYPEWRTLLVGGGWARPAGYEPEGRPASAPGWADEPTAHESASRAYRWYVTAVLVVAALGVVIQARGCTP